MSVISSSGLAELIFSISTNPPSNKIQYGIEYCNDYHINDAFIESYEFNVNPDIINNAGVHYTRTYKNIKDHIEKIYITNGYIGDMTKISEIADQLTFIKDILFNYVIHNAYARNAKVNLLTFAYYLLMVIISAYVKFVKQNYKNIDVAKDIYNIINELHNIINHVKTVDLVHEQEVNIIGLDIENMNRYLTLHGDTNSIRRFYLFFTFFTTEDEFQNNTDWVNTYPVNSEDIISKSKFEAIMAKFRNIDYDFNFGNYILAKLDILKLDSIVDKNMSDHTYITNLISNYKKYKLFRSKIPFEYDLYKYGRLIDLLASIDNINCDIFNDCFRYSDIDNNNIENAYVEIYTGRYYKFINYYLRKQNFGESIQLDIPEFHTLFMDETKEVSKNILEPLRNCMGNVFMFYLQRRRDVYGIYSSTRISYAISAGTPPIIIVNDFPVYLNNIKYYAIHDPAELKILGEYHDFLQCKDICKTKHLQWSTANVTFIKCKNDTIVNGFETVIFQCQDSWYVTQNGKSIKLPTDFTFDEIKTKYSEELKWTTDDSDDDNMWKLITEPKKKRLHVQRKQLHIY